MTIAFLGLDVGTSSAKVVAVGRDGRRIADASTPYPTHVDEAAAEQDARQWWEAVVASARRVTAGLDIRAIAVTSQAPTLVAIDADGNPTGPALTWLDRRATAEAQRIAEIAPHSRNGADAFFGTAKLLWWAEHRPEVLERASAIVSTNGAIVRRLTGIAILDDTTASLMQGFDEELGDFPPVLRAAVPALGLLAPIVPADRVVGELLAGPAVQLGISPGIPVVAGGIDAIGSALEAGALAPGDPLVEMTGFSSVTMLAVPRGTAVPGFIHSRHCLPGTDLLITAQVSAGAAIDWVNGLDPTRDHRDAAEILGRPRPGRVTMVPSLAGERTPTWNAAARGVISGIDLATDVTDLMLAVMEGNSFALARDLDAMRDAGFAVDHLLSTGGGASSDAWLQVKADVLGVPVVRPAAGHGAAQGAAYLAARAIGDFGDVEELRALAGGVEAEFHPDPRRHELYRAAAERFAAAASLNGGAEDVAVTTR